MTKRPHWNFALGAMALGFSMAPTSAAEPYVLGISDRLTVKVVHWKATDSTFEEWTALGGEYVVGADGSVNFPMLGPTEGAGQTTSDLASRLGSGLQDALGLTTAPSVSVEVAAYGPIYVSGDVATPGEYPFAPNLTVVKALALAGGERRSAEAVARPEREMLMTSGALDVLEDEYNRLLVRRARLDAELAGLDEIDVPPELADHPDLAAILAAETAILDAQKRQAEAQASSLTDEVDLLTSQIEAFALKTTSTESQLVSAREQLDRIATLSEDGLALSSRVTSLQTNVADLETRLLDTETARLEAQQAIAAASREKAQLTDEHISDLSLERQTVDGQISALALKIATQQGLVQEAVLQTGMAAPSEVAPRYSYLIIRGGDEITAEADTAVVSGDVIIARLALAK